MRLNKYDNDGNIIKRSDHPGAFQSDVVAGSPLMVTVRAVDALRDLLEGYGELLPVPSKDGEFYVYHCMNILDAIDRLQCQFDGSRIISYVFKPEVVRGQDIFVQAAPNEGPVFVSQFVVDRVKSAGLKGFKFTLVWSEAKGPIPQEPTAAPLDAPRHGKRLKPMSTSTRRAVVDKLVATARQEMKIDVAADPPEMVLERIRQEAGSARDWATRIQEAVGVSMVLGTLWGELVCREFGWQWAMVDEMAAVVAPASSHVIFPHSWFHGLLIRRGSGPSSQELFNLIKSGSLPACGPGAKLVLA